MGGGGGGRLRDGGMIESKYSRDSKHRSVVKTRRNMATASKYKNFWNSVKKRISRLLHEDQHHQVSFNSTVKCQLIPDKFPLSNSWNTFELQRWGWGGGGVQGTTPDLE